MSARKKYIISGLIGAGVTLLALAILGVTYYYYYDDGDRTDLPFDVMPSEEAMKKLEAAGVTRNEVEQLIHNISIISLPRDESVTFLYVCDERIKTGDISQEEFLACAEFIQNYYKQIGLFLENNTGLTNILNYTRYRGTIE